MMLMKNAIVTTTTTIKASVLVLVAIIVTITAVTPAAASEMLLPPSPLKQFQSGIPITEISCKDDKTLMESPRQRPACVKADSIQRLSDAGWKVVAKQQSYREPDGSSDDIKPVLNPVSIKDIIPQDITFDYALRMPPSDPDGFAEKMAVFADDEILNKRVFDDGSIKYETKKGWMNIYNYPIYYAGFKYTLIDADRIHPDMAEETTYNLLKELGITLDGTELFREGTSQSVSFTYWIAQQKDGTIINSNHVTTDFGSGHTFFYVGNWNDNLSDMNLYDRRESIDNAKEYILSIDELKNPECNIWVPPESGITSIMMLEKRPVYVISAGLCHTPYTDGHYHWYEVYVDALTGNPLFAENGVVF